MMEFGGCWTLSVASGQTLQADFREEETGGFGGESEIGLLSEPRHSLVADVTDGRSVTWTVFGETTLMVGSWKYFTYGYDIFRDCNGQLQIVLVDVGGESGIHTKGEVIVEDFADGIFSAQFKGDYPYLLRLQLLDANHIRSDCRSTSDGAWEKNIVLTRSWKGFVHSMTFSGTFSECGRVIQDGVIAYASTGERCDSFVACRNVEPTTKVPLALDVRLASGRALDCQAEMHDRVLTLRIMIAKTCQVSVDHVALLHGCIQLEDSALLKDLRSFTLQAVLRPDRKSYMKATVSELLTDLNSGTVADVITQIVELEVRDGNDLRYLAMGLLEAAVDQEDLGMIMFVVEGLTSRLPQFPSSVGGKTETIMRALLLLTQQYYVSRLHSRVKIVKFSGAMFAHGLFGIGIARKALEDVVRDAERDVCTEAFECACVFLLTARLRLAETNAGLAFIYNFQKQLSNIWGRLCGDEGKAACEIIARLQNLFQDVMQSTESHRKAFTWVPEGYV